MPLKSELSVTSLSPANIAFCFHPDDIYIIPAVRSSPNDFYITSPFSPTAALAEAFLFQHPATELHPRPPHSPVSRFPRCKSVFPVRL